MLLSHRNGVKGLGLNRNTVGGYFEDLLSCGLIRETEGSRLDPVVIGQSAHIMLEEYLCSDGRPAAKILH